MRYPLYPVGGDGQTREQFAETYVYPMIPSGRLLQYDWSSPEEMEADHLFFYLCFNNLLGMEKDFEGCFAPGATAPAAEVEAAIGSISTCLWNTCAPPSSTAPTGTATR